MAKNFNQTNINGEPADIEPLLRAYYAGQVTPSDRAERLWKQLEPSTVKPGRFGFRSGKQKSKRDYYMNSRTPLCDPVEAGPNLPEKPVRWGWAGALAGGLAMLTLIAGLILVASLVISWGQGSGPGVGNRPASVTATANPATAQPVPSPQPGFGNNAGAVSPTSQASPTTPGTTSTPTPAVTTQAAPMATPGPRLAGTDNVVVEGLQAVPITYTRSGLPLSVQPVNPAVSFYAHVEKTDRFIETLHVALVAAGYKYTSPTGSSAQGPQWQPGEIVAFYVKPGQPDLYVTVTGVLDAGAAAKVKNTGFNGGITDFENLMKELRAQNLQSTLLVVSGENLLKAMRNGQDPGAGPPAVTPTPEK